MCMYIVLFVIIELVSSTYLLSYIVVTAVKFCTVGPQLSGPHLSGFLVTQTTEMTALLG